MPTTPPSVTEKARKAANLRLLQRTCSPQITDILVSATHVVLYEYRDSAWFKSGVEGSLFLAHSAASNTLTTELIVLNRNSNDNFRITVTTHFQLQNSDPYLIFQESSSEGTITRGVWFHNATERNSVFTSLQRNLQVMQQEQQQQQAQQPSATASSNEAATAQLLATLFAGQANVSPAAATPETPRSTETMALDKKALQLALLSLIQDDRFLDLLHSQYLRVIHARAKKEEKK